MLARRPVFGSRNLMAKLKDLTRPPDLTHEERTGPVRSRRPVYHDTLPPCNAACPAGENIQSWLADVQAGHYEAAWRTIMRDNPLPAVHGRVCYHPCQYKCNRTYLDDEINIHAVERFLGDMALERGWRVDDIASPSGKKVMVIGAGPSGLSAAYHLARLGHGVTICEAGPMAGGMMHFGIPAYRLPRTVLDAEVARIEAMGVRIVLDHRVTDIMAEMEHGHFDAVFVAVGAHISKRTEIPARDAGKILDAVRFLRDVEMGEAPKLGRRVAVYGGGNTAMDAARVAKRLGATEALIIYRRDREHMPAHEFEADEAIEEGIKIKWLRTIKNIDRSTFTVEEMQLDDNGRPQPTGRFETLEADSLILAVGQDVDTGFMRNVPGVIISNDGTVTVDENLMTGYPGLFAGGDMVPDKRSITVAVGHGKKAARNIDAYLSGRTMLGKSAHKTIVGFDQLNIWYYTDASQKVQDRLSHSQRQSGFEEVVSGLGEREVVYEAQRCLSCGNCFECDGCYGACPEQAIVKLGPGKRYRYDYARCTGCAVCFEQCPCHAIEMVSEQDLPDE